MQTFLAATAAILLSFTSIGAATIDLDGKGSTAVRVAAVAALADTPLVA